MEMKTAKQNSYFQHEEDLRWKRRCFDAILFYNKQKKRIRGMENALVTAKNRIRLQSVFDALRNASHTKFLGRLGQMEVEFRADLESRILV